MGNCASSLVQGRYYYQNAPEDSFVPGLMHGNLGGNTDFQNMLERDRLESRKISKTNAVASMLDYELGEGNVHGGPSDHVPWLEDRKFCHIRMEGTTFGDVPLLVELKLEV